MGSDHKVTCVLCQRSDETKITGALSGKDDVTAHQNCLLFSSGIYCRDSPEFDDLFGFSAEDVMDEVRRGSKLTCSKCKKKGATAGCEVKRCKKSYHYPCAVEDGATITEDEVRGQYGLYCEKHHGGAQENSGSVNGHSSSILKPQTSKNPSEAGPSKMNTNDDSTAADLSLWNSDSNSSINTHLRSKRRLSFNHKEEGSHSKRKSNSWKRRIINSSSSEEDELKTEMAIFAPLESDLDESANSVPESPLIRKEMESPTGFPSGHQAEEGNFNGIKDDDETMIDSDAQSESLLLPVEICMESQSQSMTTIEAYADPTVREEKMEKKDGEGSSAEQGPVSAPDPHNTGPPRSPDHSKARSVAGSPPCTSSAISPAPPETSCVSSSPSPAAPPPEPEPSTDATIFWKRCNAAGCTQAIFTDFIKKMNDICSRIQSDQASQDDYDLALTVMEASGKLTEIVTKQQKELQRKQVELQKAVEAMKEIVSTLNR